MFIERHKDFDPRLLAGLEGQSDAELDSLTTKEARRYYNMRRAVGNCYHRAKAFIRFQISRRGVLFARIDPEHRIEDMLVKWFNDRFPRYAIVVESGRGCFICERGRVWKDVRKMEDVVAELEKRHGEDGILKELINDDSLWDRYYDSQYIPQRRNVPLFLKNVPKKFHRWAGLKKERNYRMNRKLEEF